MQHSLIYSLASCLSAFPPHRMERGYSCIDLEGKQSFLFYCYSSVSCLSLSFSLLSLCRIPAQYPYILCIRISVTKYRSSFASVECTSFNIIL